MKILFKHNGRTPTNHLSNISHKGSQPNCIFPNSKSILTSVILSIATLVTAFSFVLLLPTESMAGKGTNEKKKVALLGYCWGNGATQKTDNRKKTCCFLPDLILSSSHCEIKAMSRRPKPLGLTKDQGIEVSKTYKKFRRESGYYKSKMNLIVLKLNDELCGSKFDLATMEEQIKELKSLCSKMLINNVSTIIRLRKILNSQQRKLLNSPLFPVRSLKSKKQTKIVPCGGA